MAQPSTTSPNILALPVTPQITSPLFRKLPAEVRSEIFSYVLTDYPDPSPTKAYSEATCYTRPSYLAPRKTDIALLQTCRAVYHECWHLPFLLREQIHWAANGRGPSSYDWLPEVEKLGATLKRIREQQQLPFEIQSLRVFAQMYMLEDGNLATILKLPELHPRVLTLTIRHADWWFWEEDNPLSFEGRWIPEVNKHLSASVREIRIEIESLDRKKYQIDGIAKQMTEKWFFKRVDGAVLFAATTNVSTWRGTSKWQGERWVRDESEEGVIDYYVKTIVFRPESVLEKLELDAGRTAKKLSRSDEVPSNQSWRLHNPEWKAMPVNGCVRIPDPPRTPRRRDRLNQMRRSLRNRDAQ